MTVISNHPKRKHINSSGKTGLGGMGAIIIVYTFIIVLLWILFYSLHPRYESNYSFCSSIPMWFIYVSLPAVVIILVGILTSSILLILKAILHKQGWKQKLTESLLTFLVGGLALFVFINGAYSILHQKFIAEQLNKQFRDMTIEALKLVKNSTNREEDALTNVQMKGQPLTIICDSFLFPDSSMIPDEEYLRKYFGREIFISSALGEAPRDANSVKTIVVVERNSNITAHYTSSVNYQWVYRVTVIDWEKHQPIQTKTFEGGVLEGASVRAPSGDHYGSEPWDSIKFWLFSNH